MGKKSLYHPISLMTIRGAAAQNGFELGRITQTRFDQDKRSAHYRAVVESWPRGWDKKSQAIQKAWFNNCFSMDIWCDWAGLNSAGEHCVNLRTQFVAYEEDLTEVVPDADFEWSEDA